MGYIFLSFLVYAHPRAEGEGLRGSPTGTFFFCRFHCCGFKLQKKNPSIFDMSVMSVFLAWTLKPPPLILECQWLTSSDSSDTPATRKPRQAVDVVSAPPHLRDVGNVSLGKRRLPCWSSNQKVCKGGTWEPGNKIYKNTIEQCPVATPNVASKQSQCWVFSLGSELFLANTSLCPSPL